MEVHARGPGHRAGPSPAQPGTAPAGLASLLPCTGLLLWNAPFLEPGRGSLLLLLEAAVASIPAALVAGEPFGLREAAGCLLILAAGVLEGWAELRPGRRQVAALAPYAPASVSDISRRND